MNTFENRIHTITQHYQNNDLSLGYRRLIDTALDTQNIEIYKAVIQLTENLETNNPTPEEEKHLALQLLEKIQQCGVNSKFSPDKPIIEAHQISKSYNNGNFELGPVSLSVYPNEIVGLVGQNGNGKTTLLRLLCGQLSPNSGEIQYNFLNGTLDSYSLRTKLVYIPQRIEKLRGSLNDNLQFTCATHGVVGEENYYLSLVMLARLGLWKYRNLDWSRLSSGYKMRFELARTLLRKPEVLLLDEPLANLDILAQQVILEDLKFLSESISHPFGVVLSSQQLYEVEKVSDKIIFLDKVKMISNQSTSIEKPAQKALILEIDTTAERETIESLLNDLGLIRVQFNGGNFILHFEPEADFHLVLTSLGQAKIPITYLRDITHSSRRFFIN